MSKKKITPKDLLKARRPERFSDSIVQGISELDTGMLEYHLDTLTNREQSKEFEDFSRKLLQKTICPNLLPQTGPTGGGDSKVDSETYPVADSLAFAWYIGDPRGSSNERWAFAFSAKKDWPTKLKSDISKVVATKRGYAKAFFVTNQFVRDKDRGQFEDELRDEHKIDVRILDRSWIVAKVFEEDHVALAIDELKLSPSVRQEKKLGPLDYQKTQLLEKLEQQINLACQNESQSLGFVDDCLEAAKVAASLERPRSEIEGKYDRAWRAAEEFGTRRQKLLVAYQRAWTAYWWYEDYTTFTQQYAIVQELAAGSPFVYDFELLNNLWHIKFASAHSGAFAFNPDELNTETDFLNSELERLGNDEERPSAAYHADGLRLMMRMLQEINGDLKPTFAEMTELLETCAGLAGFPFDSFARVLIEVGRFIGQTEGYSELFESLVLATKQRRGEVQSARLLLKRASQLLEATKPVDAIRIIGRCLTDLYKHESRDELVRALYLAAIAYRQIGLLYAARGSMLAAASIATNHFWNHEQVIPIQVACYNRIKWLECELGRVPQALDWHATEQATIAALEASGYEPKNLSDDAPRFDSVLATHFLRTDLWQLKWLTKLPETLESLSLFQCSLALRYALGSLDSVRSDLEKVARNAEELDDYFAQWVKQAVELELPKKATYGDGQTVELQSRILGCEVKVESQNNLPCLTLSESILAALEAMLATGLADRVFSHEPELLLCVRETAFICTTLVFDHDNSSAIPCFKIQCNPEKLATTTSEIQQEIRDQLFALIAAIVASVFPPSDIEKTLKKWIGDDKATHRSLNFTTSFVTLRNVLGDSPRIDIGRWIDPNKHEYLLTRAVEWDRGESTGNVKANSQHTDKRPTPKSGMGEPPESRKDRMGQTSHNKLKTQSVIREAFWSDARWSGTMFAADDTFELPPLLAFVFGNREAANRIFADWRKTVGNADSENQIRVAVITGFSQKSPFAYRVVVGSGDFSDAGEEELVFLKSKVNTMMPSNHENLDRFQRSFQHFGTFGLTFAIVEPDGEMPEIDFNFIIEKNQFNVVEAWTIDRNNPLLMALKPDDDIVIPADQCNAPVVEVMAFLSQLDSTRTAEPASATIAERRKRRAELKRKMKTRKKR